MMRRLLVAAVPAALCALAAVPAAQADTAELEAARMRWHEATAEDYRYSYRRYCDCYRDMPPAIVVSVRAGRVEQALHRYEDTGTEVLAGADSLDLYWTIDELFDRLAAAYAAGAVVRAEYHEGLGYPRSIFIDYDPDFTGFETDLREIRVEIGP